MRIRAAKSATWRIACNDNFYSLLGSDYCHPAAQFAQRIRRPRLGQSLGLFDAGVA